MTFGLNKKILGLGIALIVPVMAACEQPTAQTPAEAPATQASPGVTASPDVSPTAAASTEDVASVVANTPDLSTLETAITAAGLGDSLQGDGPYTIFAPSDQAFEALPEATRQRLLQPENRDDLRQLLSYHVVEGELTSNQLSSGQVQTLEGTPLTVSVNQSGSAPQVRVNNATVSQADIPASNGVIHIVDQVILPANVSQQ